MGEMEVPAEALFGAQTARAIENFPISGQRFPREFIRALGQIKSAAAQANFELGLLDKRVADAITQASDEVAEGKWDDQFLVDIFQTGSGTSTNMNANEVIARRATELLGFERPIHPNDQVNAGQSSNDVIPSALHLAALDQITHKLEPALRLLQSELEKKAREFWKILKIGRTHLQDATPMRLGQEFSGYAAQVGYGLERLQAVKPRLGELALGGTALGTGLNTHPQFAARAIARLGAGAGLALTEARNHFEAQAARDAVVETSGMLKTIGVSLLKIANDIRFLGSGPRLGYGELQLPAVQPGSSIMPGKVNPVICEMLMQVCAQVIGNDTTITVSATHGNFELNVMMPVIARNLLESISLLGAGTEIFLKKCVMGLVANAARCERNIEESLAMGTALAPVIGYDKAAEIAKEAHRSARTVREVAREQAGLGEGDLRKVLDPERQAGGQ